MPPNDNTYRQPDEGTPDNAPINLTRIQALGIIAEASDHDDPHWEQCMEMVIGYENLEEDTILPGFDDVLRVIGVSEEEIKLVNRQAWRRQGPPPEGWRPGTENVPSADRNINRSEEE